MSDTVTDHDMRDQVAETLGADGSDFDVPAIVNELQSEYGTVHIDTIEHDAYWAIVMKHDRSA